MWACLEGDELRAGQLSIAQQLLCQRPHQPLQPLHPFLPLRVLPEPPPPASDDTRCTANACWSMALRAC